MYCIFCPLICLQFWFWSPFKINDEFYPLILSHHTILVFPSKIRCWRLQMNVDRHVSHSYWMMMTTMCHVLIECRIHGRWNTLLLSLVNQNMTRGSHYLISTWHVTVNIHLQQSTSNSKLGNEDYVIR